MQSKFRTAPGSKPSDNGLLAVQIQTRFNEGLTLHHKGQLIQAQETYRQVVQMQPNHFEALHLLGVIAAQSGHPAEALEFISRSIEINKDNATAYANLGNAHMELGRHQAAIESYKEAIVLKADYASAHLNCAKSYYALKQYQATVEFCDKAIALIPGVLEAHFYRGLALFDLRQYQAAVECYDKVIAIRPQATEAYYNRGMALQALKQHQSAIESYDKVIFLRPGAAEPHYNRGIALDELKRHQAAIESFDKALAIKPDYKFLCGTRLHAQMKISDWNNAEDQISALVRKIRQNEKVSFPFSILALIDSLPSQRQVAEIFANDHYPTNLELGSIPKRLGGGKIRLGYFSADFHNHATAYLMAELFEQHDRDKFELVAFSFGPDSNDEMRQRVVAAFDRFIDVRNRSDKEVAQLSRSLEIDIAIDQKGFTQDSRAGIFSYRIAPVQVSYLGYPGTMGADYMDYLIADKTLIPEASQAHYSEKIVYLPNSYQVNDSQRKISDKVFTREELGLPPAGFVFCCFNNNYKITPSTFDGWMRILSRVDGSVLWLLEDNPTAAGNLRQEAQQRGVSPQRLVFAQRMPLPEHLARHRAADLFIDTRPCNAHTTASDALWAGLPVLTCTGEAFASRVAASLLSAIGLPELITSTQEDYEGLAVELATNPEQLQAINHKLERNRLTTPLFDIKLFTQHIEDAYTQMVERYQAELAPDHIYVGS